jgi:hypothetical protein
MLHSTNWLTLTDVSIHPSGLLQPEGEDTMILQSVGTYLLNIPEYLSKTKLWLVDMFHPVIVGI